MNYFKKLSIAVLGLGVLAIASFFAVKTTVPSISIGAVSGPDILSPYLNVNGVTTYFQHSKLNQATTTLCSFQSPKDATTTLNRFTFQVNTGTTTSATIDMGTGATPYATTTSLFISSYSLASGAQGYFTYTSTGTTTQSVLAPGTYVNVITDSPGVGGYSYGGACNAAFGSLN